MRSPYLLLPILLVLFSLSSCSQAQTISQSTAPAPVETNAKPVVGLATPNPLLATDTPVATATFDRLKVTTEALVTRRPDSTSQGCPQELPSYPEALKISEERGQYERTTVYETNQISELIFDYYDSQLAPKGWRIGEEDHRNGLQMKINGYLIPGSALSLRVYVPELIQSTYQYTVSFSIHHRSHGGFDAYCSHLYP